MASAPQVVGSLPPFEDFGAPVYNQIHQEQIVAVETTQNTFENPAVQEQVQIVKRIQEQIVEPTDAMTYAAPSQQLPLSKQPSLLASTSIIIGLVNTQFSITGVEVSAPKTVGSFPPLEEFDAPVYNQIHQELIVATVQFRKFQRSRFWSG